VSFATITLCVASRVFVVVSVYFVIDSVQKFLDKPLYMLQMCVIQLCSWFLVWPSYCKCMPVTSDTIKN
jgi:hypothetical protein